VSPVVLRPGFAALADWRDIYRGADVSLDPIARADVEAGAAAIDGILAARELLPPLADENDAPLAAELANNGEPLPAGLLRLFAALKLGSLAQGVAGVRWEVVDQLMQFLAEGLLPAVPANGAGDRVALAQLFAALTGTGEILRKGRLRPALKALKKRGLTPLKLLPHEKWALVSGTHLSTAAALAGLFEAERVFQSALVAAAFSAKACEHATPLHPRVHLLHRQTGQIEVAASLRALLGLSDTNAAEASRGNGAGARDNRSMPMTMGAVLDLLRQAAQTLERAANGVSEEHIVLWQSAEMTAGFEDGSSVAMASDLIAMALRTISDLSERRLERLAETEPDRAQASEYEPLVFEPRASVFAAENRERAVQNGLDPARARRLLPMAGTAALVLALEFLAAARAARRNGKDSAETLAPVRERLDDILPETDHGSVTPELLAAAADLVRSGALAAAPAVALPSVTEAPEALSPRHLGARRKRK
jgi:histidine ammonia-lyase